MIPQKVMMCGDSLQPVDVWAVGVYGPSLPVGGAPIVLYKPKRGAWQIQNLGAGLANHRFFSTARSSSDPPGTVWAGGNALYKSTDYGVTWTVGPFTSTNPMIGLTATAADLVLVAECIQGTFARVNGGCLNFRIGNMSGLSSITKPTDTNVGGFEALVIPAEKSPTRASALIAGGYAIISGFFHPALFTSSDNGASWSLLQYFPGYDYRWSRWAGQGDANGHQAIMIVSEIFANTAAVLSSTDLLSWTVSQPSSDVSRGIGTKQNARWIAEFGSALYKTIDGGSSYSNAGARPLTVMRRLGNRFYGVNETGHIYSSRDGTTWAEETIPALPSGFVSLFDVNGERN
jgi:hypothetical protein